MALAEFGLLLETVLSKLQPLQYSVFCCTSRSSRWSWSRE